MHGIIIGSLGRRLPQSSIITEGLTWFLVEFTSARIRSASPARRSDKPGFGPGYQSLYHPLFCVGSKRLALNTPDRLYSHIQQTAHIARLSSFHRLGSFPHDFHFCAVYRFPWFITRYQTEKWYELKALI